MKLSKSVKLLTLVVSGVFLFSCSDNAGDKSKTTPTQPSLTTVATVEIKEDYVEITPPTTGIPGVAPEVALPDSKIWWKGVFVKDRKPVKISPYAIAKSEVTYELWREVYNWNVDKDKGYKFAEGRKGSKEDNSGDESEPVTKVSWNDAIVWCNAYTEMKNSNLDDVVYWDKDPTINEDAQVLKDASKTEILKTAFMDKSKTGFRLPTEAEWELAARLQNNGSLSPLNRLSGASKPVGFDGLALPAPESWESLYEEANKVAVFYEYWDGSNWKEQTPATTKTALVKSKTANALGIYDMSGNVNEWCFDYYADDATIADGKQNPVINPIGPSNGQYRVFRGGSWIDHARYLLVSYRGSDEAIKSEKFHGLRLVWGLQKN